MWLIRATKNTLSTLGLDSLDGEMFQHKFFRNVALVDKQYCYRFFMRRGFEDITPKGLKDDSGSYGNSLFIRWGGYGDVLLMTCAIEGFKKRFPNVAIEWLGAPLTNDLLMGNPHIERQLSILPHEVGLVVDQYDQVYDGTHAVECNSEATYTNDYDMLASWLGTPLGEEVRPYVYLTEPEYRWGEDYIRDFGFDLNKPIIGIAIEASAPRRTWPIKNSEELALRLANDGHQVVLFGAYNHIEAAHPRILNTIAKFQNMRVIASLVRQCSLMITPFTAYLHLSQAFGYKDLLVLAGPWNGELETKYYPRRWVIQGEAPCAPCYRLGGIHDQCERSQDGFGLCMQNISVDQVYEKVVSILGGASPQPFSQVFPSYRPCPACQGPSEVFTAYGKYFYLKCQSCHSVFINRLPDQVFYEPQKSNDELDAVEAKQATEILNLAGSRMEAPIRNVFEVGYGSGAFLSGCRKHGRIVAGIDIASGGVDYPRERYGLDLIEADFDTWDVPLEHTNRYQLVVLRFSIEHVNDPFGALLKCNRMLAQTGGLIYITTHDGAQVSRVQDVRRNYVMLGGNFAGEHVVLLSAGGLKSLAAQAGLQVADCQIRADGVMTAILERAKA